MRTPASKLAENLFRGALNKGGPESETMETTTGETPVGSSDFSVS